MKQREYTPIMQDIEKVLKTLDCTPPRVKVKSGYSFWRNPIKWLKQRKYRRILERLLNQI